jgi:hypothetical protein
VALMKHQSFAWLISSWHKTHLWSSLNFSHAAVA